MVTWEAMGTLRDPSTLPPDVENFSDALEAFRFLYASYRRYESFTAEQISAARDTLCRILLARAESLEHGSSGQYRTAGMIAGGAGASAPAANPRSIDAEEIRRLADCLTKNKLSEEVFSALERFLDDLGRELFSGDGSPAPPA